MFAVIHWLVSLSGGARWRPGTVWTSRWKPCLRVYLSVHESLSEDVRLNLMVRTSSFLLASKYSFSVVQNLLGEVQLLCQSSGTSVVFIQTSSHNLPEGTLVCVCVCV